MLHILPEKISLERVWYFVVIHGTRFGLTRDNEKIHDNDMRQVFTILSASWLQECLTLNALTCTIIPFCLNSTLLLMQTFIHLRLH